MRKIDPAPFLEIVRPALQEGDAGRLARDVLARWRPREICTLLRHPERDVRRVAAVTLGMVGDRSCIGCLTRALHDEDEQVNEMAEHGLWSVWFRTSRPAAAKPFREGVAMLSMECHEAAIEKFDEAIRADPQFAEAYNQRSIAHFLAGAWEASLSDGEQTVLRMPTHFGAIAGMGHAYMHLDERAKALTCYQRALTINPRMPAIARAVQRLSQKLHGEKVRR